MLDQEQFWKILKFLMQMEKTQSFDEICADLKITKEHLGSIIHFLNEINFNMDYSVIHGEQRLSPPNQIPIIKFEFNLLEWLQFQAHFPVFASMQGKPFYQDICNKLSQIESQYSGHDLFSAIETLQEVLKSNHQSHIGEKNPELLHFIEDSILDKKCIRLKLLEKSMIVYPHRVVYLEGKLSLVAEDTQDKCLVNISLDQIQNLYEDSYERKPIYSKFEIAEFIQGLRNVTESEVRLVLKVYSYEKFDPKLEHHFLGNPCMITNSQGEAIWAASIEPNDQLFQWLENLGADVEILDPIDIKKQFLKYCENKLKKIA